MVGFELQGPGRTMRFSEKVLNIKVLFETTKKDEKKNKTR